MAITRMTLEEAMALPPNIDQAKLDATTEEDVRAMMIEDGEDPDANFDGHVLYPPRHIRQKLGMTQGDFAALLNISLDTLLDWERNSLSIGPAGQALLTILAREPEAALRALGHAV